jgi:hypothetical protein
VVSTVVSMHFGFSTTLVLGIATYLLGGAIVGGVRREASDDQSTQAKRAATRAAV